jgi:hypothetical protein
MKRMIFLYALSVWFSLNAMAQTKQNSDLQLRKLVKQNPSS